MKILSIESSCDETSAAVVEKIDSQIKILSNITATSLSIHSKTGGIIPENAAREQVKYIMPVIVEVLLRTGDAGSERKGRPMEHPQSKTRMSDGKGAKQDQHNFIKANQILKDEIDAIAVTYGPGLIGSLLVGVETAKTLSYVFNKPLITVNHLLAHIYANFITSNIQNQTSTIHFPFVGLIVSGGHTDLLLFKNHGEFKWLGGTRDDAAGEAFDKIGRLLDLSYPAGPEIEKRSGKVTNPTIKFKSPLISSDDFDFSFSGLKTEVLRFVEKNPEMSESLKNQICYATQKAIIDVLVTKTLKAAKEYNCKTVLIGGGVSANNTLRELFSLEIKNQKLETNIFFPEKKYSTDNGAMIGAYSLLNPNVKSWQEVKADPELYFA